MTVDSRAIRSENQSVPPAGSVSVTSAASVLNHDEAAELAAIAVELPDGWCVAVERWTGQVCILPLRDAAEWKHTVVVDPSTRRVYAGMGWTARHTRDVKRVADAERRAHRLGGGTARSSKPSATRP